jgi:uncharacterized protein (TIGR03083 family)
VHLGLVTVVVSDYDAAIDFFVRALGFELAEDSPARTPDGRGKRWVVVRPPAAVTGLLLARADGPEQAAAVGRQAAGRVGFFLHVEDFGAAYQRMLAAGVEFLGPPRAEPYGQVAVFRDIAGNKWDLLGPGWAGGEHARPDRSGRRPQRQAAPAGSDALVAGDGAGMSGGGPSAEPPADYASLFTVERDRLTELLAGLHSSDWELPSPCPGWTVLGLCCHLLGDDLGLLARHRDGYYGTPGPDGATEAEFVAWLDELQADWVRAARRLSPRLVTELLAWGGPQLAETFRRQDPRARTASVSWAGPEPVPAWLDQARELSEYWIHRQQLLQALGRPSDLRADLAGPVLDGLAWAWPYRLARAPARAGDTVSIHLTEPVARTWHLVAAAAGWEFADQPGPRPAASLTMSTEQAWRLLTNNLPADRQAHLTASGDNAIINILLQTRAIIGAPKWA